VIEDLLKIAEIQGLSGREAVRSRAIHWLIDLNDEGEPLQLSPTTGFSKGSRSTLSESRGKRFPTPRLYHMQVIDGAIKSVCTNQHNWLPDFLIGPAAEIFPRGANGKQSVRDNKRRETWKVVFEAASDPSLSGHPGLVALVKFLKSRPQFEAISLPVDDSVERESILKAIAEGKELLSFRVGGRLLVHDSQLKQWWERRVERMRKAVCDLLPPGEDSYEPGAGSLAEYHPTVFSSIPLCSYDKAPFISFGLGRQTTRLRLETSEKIAAALNWLLNDDSSSLRLGEYSAVFWAVSDGEAHPVDFGSLLNAADPLAVRDFLRGPWSGVERELDTTRFHAALLRKSGKGRFAVSSWHTNTLKVGRANLKAWFKAIEIPNLHSREPAFVTIRDLAECTVRKSRETRPLPTTFHTLFECALFGNPMPHKLLAAVVARQSMELATGTDKKKRNEFESRLTARTALIQAFFALKKGTNMSDDPKLEDSPGYWCGRLLAILDRIHNEAHDNKTNSSPANRSYGAASTTPALIFPQLCKLVRIHLSKVKGKRDSYGNMAEQCLEFGYPQFKPPLEGLADVCAKLRTTGAEFPRTLSLQQQGHFAIGFYYERCLRWPEFNARTQETSDT